MDYLLIIFGITLIVGNFVGLTNSIMVAVILYFGLCFTVFPLYNKLSKIEVALEEQRRLLNKPSKDKDTEAEDTQNKEAEDD